MDNWLKVFMDPGSVAQQSEPTQLEQFGMALLLDGQFLRYVRSSDQMEMPALVGPPSSFSKGTFRLLSAFVADLRGDADAAERYDDLLARWRTGHAKRTIASILASIQSAGVGQHERAV